MPAELSESRPGPGSASSESVPPPTVPADVMDAGQGWHPIGQPVEGPRGQPTHAGRRRDIELVAVERSLDILVQA